MNFRRKFFLKNKMVKSFEQEIRSNQQDILRARSAICGNGMRVVRKEICKLSRNEAALWINVNSTTLRRAESGKRPMSYDNLRLLAELFRFRSVSEFLDAAESVSKNVDNLPR